MPVTAKKNNASKRKESPLKNPNNRGKPFEKGNPGGPGRPPGFSRSTVMETMRAYLVETEGKAEARNRITRFIHGFFDEALNGDGWQAQMLAERVIEKDLLDKITTQLDAGRREDEDFMAYRCLKNCFGPQLHYAWSKARISAAMAGRRAGKTEGNVRAVGEKICRRNSPVLILGLTFSTTIQLYWDKIVNLCEEIGLEFEIKNRTEGHIKITNGAEVYFRGNSTRDEREKLRGFKWARVVVDEVQSQKALAYLLDEILVPACVDLKGDIKLSGTGPRVRGTYWEVLWSTDPTIDKYNWNLLSNPHIPDGAEELKRIREAKGLTEASPLYIREYLGKIAYDDDALVYRLKDDNFYTDAQLADWITHTPRTDLRISAGIDLGFEDADALAVVLYAEGKPEMWLIGEYKQRREGLQALADAVRAALAEVGKVPGLAGVDVYLYIDEGGGGKKSSYELATVYGLECQPAYKQDKALGVEILQDDVRTGRLKVKRGGIFEDEALKIVFRRDDADNLTREIDDDTYHPDLADALLYAVRPIQLYSSRGVK